MSGDNGKQLSKTRSKKRRHLCIIDTDSSDDAAVSTMKPRRKPRVNKTTSDSNKKDRDKSIDSEVAGSSKSEVDKNPVEETKGASAPTSVKKEAKNSRDSKSRRSSETSKKAVGEDAAESPEVEIKKDEKSDESAEHCPICWVPFKQQEVAVPATCDHSFCLQCIVKWTGHSNTCPVDRLSFNVIDVYQNYGGKKLRQMPIATRTPTDVVTGDEAGDGDNSFGMSFSNSASSEWDLELSNSELDYDSSVHDNMMFGSGNDPDDSIPTSDDSDTSPMDMTPSEFEDIYLESLGQDGSSSVSCQNASSPSRSHDSNVGTSEDFSTPPHQLITLEQDSFSELSAPSMSSVDSLPSYPSPSSPETPSSSTSY